MDNSIKAAFRWLVFVLAVAATTAWVVLSFTYLNRLGWDGILSLEPGALAATLAAVAGPPAALWLVLVVIAQQQELSLLRKTVLDLGVAVRRGQDHAEISSRTLIELTSATTRGAAKDSVHIALDDLASHAAVVAERLGVLDGEGLDLAWARHGAGDRWALIRPFIVRASEEKDFGDRLTNALNQDGPAKVAAAAFIHRLKSLRHDHIGVGDQKLLSQILEDGPLAQIERLFDGVQNDEPMADQDVVESSSEDSPELESENADVTTLADRLGPQPTLFPAGTKTG